MRLALFACLAVVCAIPLNDPWKVKYENRWGPIRVQAHGTGRPPYSHPFAGRNSSTLRSIVSEWESSTESTACYCSLFKQNLTVWTNGYVIPQSEDVSPTSATGYAELYKQRELIDEVASLLANETLSSESDYPWTIFSTPSPKGTPLTAALFSRLLGFTQVAQEVPDMITEADTVMKKALAKLDAESLTAFQSTDKSFCHGFSYIVNPTFLVSQRPDGTLIGVAATAIWT